MLAIFQKTLRADVSNSVWIRSAFTRDFLQGCVYVEAESLPAVVKVLRGIVGVARIPGSGSFGISLVDIQDRPLLLDMELNGLKYSIKPSSWVRIKVGLHKGDLALVRHVDNSSPICEVYVVPRLAYDGIRKRGRRPPLALFEVERAERVFKSKVEIRNQARLFRGKMYLKGLLLEHFHMYKLTSEGVNATEEELQRFRHLPEWDEAQKYISPIKLGDRVRVISGTFKGGWGITTEIKELSVSLIWEGNEQDVRDILTRDIRKVFHLGDFVQVLYGPNRGDQGFVVHLGAEQVVLYKHQPATHIPAEQYIVASGSEVGVSSCRILPNMTESALR